jgi:hypothetical protein
MSDHVSSVLMRLYEALAGGLHERAVHSVTKAQLALETATTAKIAAVAASAAAAAGGGIATVERTVERKPQRHEKRLVVHKSAKRAVRSASVPAPAAAPSQPVVPPPPTAPAPAPQADQGPSQSDTTIAEPQATSAEFDFEGQAQAASAGAADLTPVLGTSPPRKRSSARKPSPITAPAADDEFGP